MLLELSHIAGYPGASRSFSESVDLHDLRYGNSYPVPEPVRISGVVRNTAGVLLMSGTVGTTLHGVCDRCAADFVREVAFPLRAVLTPDAGDDAEEDEEWVFPLKDGCADLEEIARTVFVLSLGSRLLCRPDCKGVCFRCGKNLNDGPCGCRKEPDSRFAALQQLLDS